MRNYSYHFLRSADSATKKAKKDKIKKESEKDEKEKKATDVDNVKTEAKGEQSDSKQSVEAPGTVVKKES